MTEHKTPTLAVWRPAICALVLILFVVLFFVQGYYTLFGIV
jgi:hypothetical protein